MAGLASRRRARAIARQDSGYRGSFRRLAQTVPLKDWASQFDAAEALGIGLFRVGVLIQAGTLVPAHDPAGRGGVTRASLESAIAARRPAAGLRRVRLFVGDLLRALARGI
jgi:hypothetical protein